MEKLLEIIRTWYRIPGALQNITTIKHFLDQANAFIRGQFAHEYDAIMAEYDADALVKIKEVKCGYIVDNDNIIHCSPDCGFYVAEWDGCEECEMFSGINALIKGY